MHPQTSLSGVLPMFTYDFATWTLSGAVTGPGWFEYRYYQHMTVQHCS